MQEFPEWAIDAIHGAEYVAIDPDLGLLAAWQGAGIFNVYRLSDGEPVDCWTTDGAPGPEFSESRAAWNNSRNANHGDAVRWAEAECREYFARITGDVLEGEFE